jgi:hypothetical protein
METALQELIRELQIEMQKAQEQDSPNIASGFWHSIVKAQAKLPEEREQIIDAYKADLYPCSDEDAANYYETNFNK